MDTHENEVARAFRTVNEGTIEPVSFIVPRRAEVFQDDIYPPAVGLKPSMSAAEWFSGQEGLPPKINMESLFEGQTPEEVPSDFKPSAVATPVRSQTPQLPTPTKQEPEMPAPVTAQVARAPPPSVKDNQASLASAASKYAEDDDDVAPADDTSGFEDVAKPVVNPIVSTVKAAAQSVASVLTPSSASTAEPTEESSTPVSKSVSVDSPEASASSESTTAAQRATSGEGGGAAAGLRSVLADIRSTLESQQKLISEQSEQLEALTKEVQLLKAGGGHGA